MLSELKNEPSILGLLTAHSLWVEQASGCFVLLSLSKVEAFAHSNVVQVSGETVQVIYLFDSIQNYILKYSYDASNWGFLLENIILHLKR